jgi:hypothetical protein
MKLLDAIDRNRRKILYSIVYLTVIIISVPIIHETAHILTALAFGVPFNEIKITILHFTPTVQVPSSDLSNTQFSVLYYVGGSSVAGILIIIYFSVWSRYRKLKVEPSLLVWFCGFLTLGICGEQIGNAIVEGRFHTLYIYFANSPFGMSNMMLLWFMILGFVVHSLLFLFLKNREEKENRSPTL